MQKLLTEAAVAKLKPDPSKRLEIHDEVVSGLRLRISPRGKKSWSLMYKVAGAALDGKRGPNRRMTLGAYPLVDLKAARLKAGEAKELADRGLDPIEAQKQIISGLKERRFELVLDRFIELHAKPNTKNWKETERLLRVSTLSRWAGMDIQTIDRARVHSFLDSLSEEKGANRAREVRKHLSIMFNWAADRGICPFSPMAGMKRADLRYRPRERVLSMEELSKIWEASHAVGYPFGSIVQLLMLTGQRRSEIAGLRRNWLQERSIEIPASEYKTKKAHVVPITDCMREILEVQPIWNGGEFVFSTTNGRTASSGFSKAKRRYDALSGVSEWTFHDIRRSVATHMARAGVIQEHMNGFLVILFLALLGHTISILILMRSRQHLSTGNNCL